jgi:membrane protease YdiL (CAAX protease family)
MTMHEVVLALVPLAAITGSLAVWVVVVARLRRHADVVALEPRRPVPWALLDLALVLIVYFVLMVLGGWMLRDFWQIELPDEARDLSKDLAAFQFLDMAARLITVGFALALVWIRTRATIADLGLSLKQWRYDLAVGGLGFVALAAPVYSLQALLVHFFPTQHPLIEVIEENPSNWTFFIVGLSVSVVAPLSEEFLLRVLVQGWLERVVAEAVPSAFPGENPLDRSNLAGLETALPQCDAPATIARRANIALLRWTPVFTSATIFALLHFGQGPAPIPLFFLALGLGYLYQRTHRLWPSAIVHFLLNSSSLAILWLQTM